MSQRRRLGEGLTLVLLAAALAIGIAIVNVAASRYYVRFDWTRAGIYSISDRTRQVLASVQQPLRIVVFLHGQGNLKSRVFDEVRELVEQLATASDRISVEMVDPFKNRALAEELVRTHGIQRPESIILEYGTGADLRRHFVAERDLGEWDYTGLAFGHPPELVAFRGEEVLAAAIDSLVTGRKPRVLFTAGHGEPSFKGTKPNELGRAADALRRENYQVQEWTSLTAERVPEGTEVLIVAGPRRRFEESELGALRRFLADGGRLLLLLDPVFDPETGALFETGLEPLVGEWGLRLGRDVVVDPASPLPFFGIDTIFTNRLRAHEVTKGLDAFPIMLPLARSVAIERPVPGYDSRILFETSHQGWAETDLESLPDARRDESDLPGPVPLAVAIGPAAPKIAQVLEDTVPGAPKHEKVDAPGGGQARLIVIGDSDLLSNEIFDRNAPHIPAMINWLAGRESLLGIPSKRLGRVALRLTRDQIADIQIFTFGILPGLVVAIGLLVWWRRRN